MACSDGLNEADQLANIDRLDGPAKRHRQNLALTNGKSCSASHLQTAGCRLVRGLGTQFRHRGLSNRQPDCASFGRGAQPFDFT